MATADDPTLEEADERSAASIVLSLAGLAALAVTRPLLDLLGRNAAFVVAHDLRRLDVVLMTVVLVFGLPLAAAGVVLLVRTVHHRAGTLLHELLIAVFVAIGALWALQVSGLGAAMPGPVALTIATIVGVGIAVAYHRIPRLRLLLSWAAIAAPLAAVVFLVATPVRGVLFPAAPAAGTTTATGTAPPVVVVIFDELPLATLLDDDHRVDREAFPSFGRLAQDATFFRNATASHSSTVEAVPSLLSGRYAQVNTLPTANAHPTNLFSVLGGTYQVHALEPLTDLCAECGDDIASDTERDVAALLRDLGVLQLHLVVPQDWAAALPPVDGEWRDFGRAEAAVLDREGFLDEARGLLRKDSAAAFRGFTRAITPAPRPTLHVLHTLLPHRPWRYLPDGRRHGGVGDPALGEDGWTTRPWPMAQSLQLHLAQSQLADRLLGQLLRRLEETGLYDRSLLVVVADHGLSLLPGTPPRDVTAESLRQIAPVPLFIKAPHQTVGSVDDRPVETVDVVPTILDQLDVDIAARLDGMSLLASDAPQRQTKRLVDADGKTWEFDTSQASLFEAVRRKLDLFGNKGRLDVFGLAPLGFDHLLGRRVDPATESEALTVALERPAVYERVRLSGPMVPALVAGQIHGLAPHADPPVLAVAVNGVVAAVTLGETGQGPNGKFRALVPPTSFRDGANDVAILLVEPDASLRKVPHTR